MSNRTSNNTYILEEMGIISRSLVQAEFFKNSAFGLRFCLPDSRIFSAHLSNIQSTQRNTVIGDEQSSVCLVEHYLAACALLNLQDYDLKLSEYELPFGDGSALFWIKYFRENSFSDIPELPTFSSYGSRLQIQEPIKVFDEEDSSRYIEIHPTEGSFSLEYVLDHKNPAIGLQNYIWRLGSNSITELASARTFSSKSENQILGLDSWVLGYDENGFDQDLHSSNEPACHKALDLLGDLMLVGVNPIRIDISIKSVKGGHSLNAKAAAALELALSKQN